MAGIGADRRRIPGGLTERQIKIARLFARGDTWEQVMAQTGCSRSRVHKEREALYAALGVMTMPEVWAALGWLSVPEPDDGGSDEREAWSELG